MRGGRGKEKRKRKKERKRREGKKRNVRLYSGRQERSRRRVGAPPRPCLVIFVLTIGHHRCHRRPHRRHSSRDSRVAKIPAILQLVHRRDDALPATIGPFARASPQGSLVSSRIPPAEKRNERARLIRVLEGGTRCASARSSAILRRPYPKYTASRFPVLLSPFLPARLHLRLAAESSRGSRISRVIMRRRLNPRAIC